MVLLILCRLNQSSKALTPANWAVVAPYPRYGCGVGGWRNQLTLDGNQRAKEHGHAGFWVWLVGQARGVPQEYLMGDLPEV